MKWILTIIFSIFVGSAQAASEAAEAAKRYVFCVGQMKNLSPAERRTEIYSIANTGHPSEDAAKRIRALAERARASCTKERNESKAAIERSPLREKMIELMRLDEADAESLLAKNIEIAIQIMIEANKPARTATQH
jgi:hypothetical protein